MFVCQKFRGKKLREIKLKIKNKLKVYGLFLYIISHSFTLH